jgi:cbb3-type cytochrome oxidase maturation protein
MLFVLVPLSLMLLAVAIWAFFWAVRNDQFDDMETPPVRILLDEQQDGDD